MIANALLILATDLAYYDCLPRADRELRVAPETPLA